MSRLSLFLSLLIHAALVAAVFALTAPPRLGPGRRPISVAVFAPGGANATESAPTPVRASPRALPPRQSVPLAPPAQEATPRPDAPTPSVPGVDRDGNTGEDVTSAASAAQSDATTASGDAGESLSRECWERVAALLRERTYTHLPRALLRRGLTGALVVRFRLAADGTVTDARIEESSGRVLLDAGALELLKEPLVPGCPGEGRWPLRFHRDAPAP